MFLVFDSISFANSVTILYDQLHRCVPNFANHFLKLRNKGRDELKLVYGNNNSEKCQNIWREYKTKNDFSPGELIKLLLGV